MIPPQVAVGGGISSSSYDCVGTEGTGRVPEVAGGTAGAGSAGVVIGAAGGGASDAGAAASCGESGIGGKPRCS